LNFCYIYSAQQFKKKIATKNNLTKGFHLKRIAFL